MTSCWLHDKHAFTKSHILGMESQQSWISGHDCPILDLTDCGHNNIKAELLFLFLVLSRVKEVFISPTSEL